LLTKRNMKAVLDLQAKYEARGLTVLAFLSNMSNQENRTTEQSMTLIRDRYKAEKLLWFQKVEVNGP
jgi:glutathione peroxidase-family protein